MPLSTSRTLRSRPEEIERVKGVNWTHYHPDDMPPGCKCPPKKIHDGIEYIDSLYIYPSREFNMAKLGVTKLTHDQLQARHDKVYYGPLSRFKDIYKFLMFPIVNQSGISRGQVEALMFHLFHGNRSVI